MSKIVEIRNSTAEFLTFVAANKEEGVQVVYKDETIWATQQAIAVLFDKNKSTISRHIANINSEGDGSSGVCRESREAPYPDDDGGLGEAHRFVPFKR